MSGLPGASGYSHLMPYARDKQGLETTKVPFIDLNGECPLDDIQHPALPAELAGLPIKRTPAVWYTDWDSEYVPSDYTNESNACNDSLDQLWEFVQGQMCTE